MKRRIFEPPVPNRKTPIFLSFAPDMVSKALLLISYKALRKKTGGNAARFPHYLNKSCNRTLLHVPRHTSIFAVPAQRCFYSPNNYTVRPPSVDSSRRQNSNLNSGKQRQRPYMTIGQNTNTERKRTNIFSYTFLKYRHIRWIRYSLNQMNRNCMKRWPNSLTNWNTSMASPTGSCRILIRLYKPDSYCCRHYIGRLNILSLISRNLLSLRYQMTTEHDNRTRILHIFP